MTVTRKPPRLPQTAAPLPTADAGRLSPQNREGRRRPLPEAQPAPRTAADGAGEAAPLARNPELPSRTLYEIAFPSHVDLVHAVAVLMTCGHGHRFTVWVDEHRLRNISATALHEIGGARENPDAVIHSFRRNG